MVDRETLKQAACYRINERRQRVVEIPAELWEEWVTEELNSAAHSQKDKILAAWTNGMQMLLTSPMHVG